MFSGVKPNRTRTLILGCAIAACGTSTGPSTPLEAGTYVLRSAGGIAPPVILHQDMFPTYRRQTLLVVDSIVIESDSAFVRTVSNATIDLRAGQPAETVIASLRRYRGIIVPRDGALLLVSNQLESAIELRFNRQRLQRSA
jgi:hypothetical protein